MSFLDKMKGKVGAAVDKHGNKVTTGIDKAVVKIDNKTDGKYTDKLATGAEKAKGALDNLDTKNSKNTKPTKKPKGN